MLFDPNILSIISGVVAVISIVIAVVSMIFNIRNANKTIYMNAITSSRVKTMDSLRNHIGEFCTLLLKMVNLKLSQVY